MIRLLSVFATGLALVLPFAVESAAQTLNTVTTNKYYGRSTSNDIANSCKELWITGGSGVISANCNEQATNDDHISPVSTTYDIDNAVYCPEPMLAGQSAVIAWGAQSSSDVYEPTSWSIKLDSNGDDYILRGLCDHTGSGPIQPFSELDLGDTSSGLKNNNGKLEKR